MQMKMERRDTQDTPLQTRIVIVDDQSTGRKILEKIIQELSPHLQVDSFANPLEAIASLPEQTPDLILVDYKMPDMDGLEFTRQVRRLPGCSPHAPGPLVVRLISNWVLSLPVGTMKNLMAAVIPGNCRARKFRWWRALSRLPMCLMPWLLNAPTNGPGRLKKYRLISGSSRVNILTPNACRPFFSNMRKFKKLRGLYAPPILRIKSWQ
jgi:CheY-like chemotaxis protein